MDNENVHPTLGAVIPSATGRKVAYAIYALVAFVVGNAVVFFAATQMEAPVWLIGAVAVVNNIAPVFGAVAIANAPASPKQIAKAQAKEAAATAIEQAPVVEEPTVAMHDVSSIPDPE